MAKSELARHPLGDKLDLRPYEGLGPFRLGMYREEVAEILADAGLHPEIQFNETIHDAWKIHFLGMAVEFARLDGTANSIIVYPHGSPPIVAGGFEVQGTWHRIIKDLSRAGHPPVKLERELLPGLVMVCETLGLSLQKHDERNAVAEIRAYRRGFWEHPGR